MATDHSHTSKYLLHLALAVLLAGCAGEVLDAGTGSFPMNASGGKVALTDGAEVIVPPGALQARKVIGIASLGEGAFSVNSFTPVGSFYQLSPAGQTFAQPISLFLPYDYGLVGGASNDVRVFMSRNAGATFEALPGIASPQLGKAGGQTTHFSIVVAGLPQGGQSPSSIGEQQNNNQNEDPSPGEFHDGCTPATTAGCGGCPCEEIVCEVNSACCISTWTDSCSSLCSQLTDSCDEPFNRDEDAWEDIDDWEEDDESGSEQATTESGEEGTSETEEEQVSSCANICGDVAPSGCSCAPSCLANQNCCSDACQACSICETGCGNNKCESGETCVSCPEDCGECSFICGDGICGQTENCETCEEDCCAVDCGNGICDGGESCGFCPSDCGPCQSASCVGNCEEYNPDISCYCDSSCLEFDDCCDDACSVCGTCPTP